MSLKKYLLSSSFFIRLALALSMVALLVFGLMYWLDFATNHGTEIEVPDLSRLSEEQAEAKLDESDLGYILLDSVDYRANFPAYSVVEQSPKAGAKVKSGRKIYIKINSSGFSMVSMPKLIDKTYREVVPTLTVLGLEVGKITYEPYLAKDVLLQMSCDGKSLKAGDKVIKHSKIDLVLGDGKIGYEESVIENDSIVPTE
jgi:eukaryotic-like serine/threonine-protein kinase